MSMSFQPKTEKELRGSALAPDGDYDFEVLFANDEVSKKSGNPMIKAKLGLHSGESVRWHVFDYLLPAMEAKLRHFCDSTGLLAKYEAGTLAAEDCVGRAGRVRIIIKEDKEGKYPDKNEVKDYILRPAKPIGQTVKAVSDTPPDDVPF